MKRIARSLFVLAILLAVAQPTFACLLCNWDGSCIHGQGGPRCRWLEDGGCEPGPNWCATAPVEPLAVEFQIASIEIAHDSNDVRVAQATKVETRSPAAVVELDRIRK